MSIKIKTQFCAESSTRPARIKAWAQTGGRSRAFITVLYDRRLARDYGAEAPFRDAAEQLALQCRLGLVGESKKVDRYWIFQVSEDPTRSDRAPG